MQKYLVLVLVVFGLLLVSTPNAQAAGAVEGQVLAVVDTTTGVVAIDMNDLLQQAHQVAEVEGLQAILRGDKAAAWQIFGQARYYKVDGVLVRIRLNVDLAYTGRAHDGGRHAGMPLINALAWMGHAGRYDHNLALLHAHLSDPDQVVHAGENFGKYDPRLCSFNVGDDVASYHLGVSHFYRKGLNVYHVRIVQVDGVPMEVPVYDMAATTAYHLHKSGFQVASDRLYLRDQAVAATD